MINSVRLHAHLPHWIMNSFWIPLLDSLYLALCLIHSKCSTDASEINLGDYLFNAFIILQVRENIVTQSIYLVIITMSLLVPDSTFCIIGFLLFEHNKN